MFSNYTFINQQDTQAEKVRIGHYICNRCGAVVESGIINFANHESDFHAETVLYKVLSDNEMRIAFMEHGLQSDIFEAFGYAIPTPTEKEIYKQ